MPGLEFSLGLLVSAAMVCWVSMWLARHLWPGLHAVEHPLQATIASVGWFAVLLCTGLLGARYVERTSHPVLGYAVLAIAALALSLAHTLLRMRLTWAWRDKGSRKEARMALVLFLTALLIALVLGAIPIVASDLFRMPYSPAWRTINRVMDRLDYTYNPSGGGETPSFPPWRNPGDAGLAYSDVTLMTADGLHLAAWFVPAPGPSTRSILLCHGLQDSKWTLLRLIPWLHGAGYHVMAVDLRGHGQSDKRPTTLGPEEALDIRAALDWLETEGVGSEVAGLGQSLGAAALVNTAVEDSRLKALILDSLFAEWRNVDYARGYRLPPEWLVPGVPDPAGLIRQIHIPVFVIHGTADILVHVDHAERLFQAANEPRTLWINDSGHAWSAWTYPQLYQEKVLGFLEEALGAQGE